MIKTMGLLSFTDFKSFRNSKNVKMTFILPDGQRVNTGYGKARIDCVWSYCRKNIISKLRLAIAANNVDRQKLLIKYLNIVADDNVACNYLNGFSPKFVSLKIDFETFNNEYKDRLIMKPLTASIE